MKKEIFLNGIVYIILVCVIGYFVNGWIPVIWERGEDLIKYRVVDIYEDGRMVVDINGHIYLMSKSFENCLFSHWVKCPKCVDKFVVSTFSIYDGFSLELQEKYKKIAKKK